MPYAILLNKRLTSSTAIRRAADHVTRHSATANADPSRESKVLRGMLDGWTAVCGRISQVGARSRRGSVLAWEALMSASPDYFRPAGGPAGACDRLRLDAWWPRAFAWVLTEWGDDNVVGAYLHLDESTPHIHALCVPIDPHTSRLCSAHWFKNRDVSSAVQDRHAEAMAPLGLERGIRGSRATHHAIRRWYAQMQAPVAQVPDPQVGCPPLLLLPGARAAWARGESERLRGEQADAIDCLATQARSAKEATLRRREMEETLRHLGRAKACDREDAQRWRRAHGGSAALALREAAALFPLDDLQAAGIGSSTDGFRTGRINEGTVSQLQPRNALELIMHMTGHDRIGALRWLSGRRGPDAAERLATAIAFEEARDEARLASTQALEPGFVRERIRQALDSRGIQDCSFTAMQRRFHLHGFSLRRSHDRMEVRDRFSGKVLEEVGKEAIGLPSARSIEGLERHRESQDLGLG